MTDQVFSMGENEEKESGQDEEKVFVPTLVRILEGLEIVQVAAGEGKTIFLISKDIYELISKIF